MAPRNPLIAGKWTVKQFKATVINDIWPEITFFTLVATMVALVSEQTNTSLGISNQMLTVLGTVLGLVVSFRTSSAYDRYWEGRKLWTNINLASRNIAHMIWIHVSIDREDKQAAKKGEAKPDGEKAEISEQSRLKAVIEKKTMINLVQAFSVSVKHMLRGEPGIYYQDLYPLICFLPRYASHPPENQTEADTLPLWDDSINQERTATKSYPVHTRQLSHSAPIVHRSASSPPPSSPVLESNRHDLEKNQLRPFSNPLSHMFAAHSDGELRRKDTFNPERVLPRVTADRPLAPARNPPKSTIYDYLPMLIIFKPLIFVFKFVFSRSNRNRLPALSSMTKSNSSTTVTSNPDRTPLGRKRRPGVVNSNVPLEITLYLSSYLAWLLKNGLLTPAIATALTNSLASLQDTMASLDRIRTTPIPYAYQAHLRMTIWLYLFFLPFQIYTAFGYLIIPATAFASFLLLGFLEIGQEIENPFNYDPNDLDLDHFCLSIERELHEITAHPSPDPDSYIFSPWNQPFAPADRRTAEEILRDVNHEYHGPEVGLISVRRTLLRNWRQVNDVTTDLNRWSGT